METPEAAALADRLSRLDKVESRLAIAELVHTYARCIRYDRPDEVGTLFTEDGSFELRDGESDKADFAVKYRLEGRASVHAQMAQNKGNPHPVPLIHNLIIDLDGDHATSTCVMEGIIYGTSYGFQGEYHDTFRREGSRWLFSERIFTMFRAASPV